ncbi:MAG: FHA domain-containing protein [Lachnospiraceae bacterium]|nr:FHA domain-containing protein [Lachnospiraceae bacterium]
MQTTNTGFTVTRSIAMNSEVAGAVIGTKGHLLGKIIKLKDKQVLVFGRDASQCDVLVKGEKVSRVHCSIRYDAKKNEYIVRDCSTNGVVVNQKYKLKKDADVRVTAGSTVWLGNSENEITLG